MASDTWVSFVSDCELFSVAPNCVPAGVSTGTPLAQCKRPSENAGFFLTSGKASFLNSLYGYGTGFVPNVGNGWETVAAEGAVSIQSSGQCMDQCMAGQCCDCTQWTYASGC